MTSDRSGWSLKEDKTLERMLDEGCTASQIARELTRTGKTRSRNSVLGRIHRQGLQSKNQNKVRPRPLPVRAVDPKPRKDQRALIEAARDGEDEGPANPPISTLDLKQHHCRWPYTRGSDTHYCGKEPVSDRPFCPYHCTRAYEPPKKAVV